MLKQLITIALVLPLVTACATSTRFHTTPEGAKVYVNGDFIGVSPVTLNDSKSLPKRLHIQVRHAGYKELDMYLDKRADYVNMVLSVLPYTAPLIFWGYTLDDKYRFNLTPLKLDGAKSPEAAPKALAKE